MGNVAQGQMQGSERKYLSFAKAAGHNPWLDLLRALAIVLVLLRHGSRAASTELPGGFVSNILANGWVGVDLFFVLSGYLIASGLIRRSESESALFPTGYFRDRILRIVPAFYAVLFLCTLGFFPGFQINSHDPGQSFAAHLIFLQDYTGSDINVVFWSLGVEEKFYILAPALVLLLLRARTAMGCMALGVSFLLISPILRGLTFETFDLPISYPDFFQALRSPFHMSTEGFAVGIMVAFVRSRGWAVARINALAGLSIAAAALVIFLGSHDFYADITRFDAWLQPMALALVFGFMLFCAGSLGDAELPFEPFFRVNARLSYALYLVHFPLIPLALSLSHNQHSAAFWSMYLLLTYAGALLLHFCVEKPFLVMKQKMNARGRQFARAKITEAVPS